MEESQQRCPSLIDALRAILQDDFDETIEYNRAEIRITQGGEVIYRLYERGGDDPVGGVAVVS